MLLLLTPTPPPPTLAPTTTPIGADRLGYGEFVSGTLTAQRTERLYQFEAHAGDLILATMDRTDGTLDPLLILTDAAQKNVLATDNDSGGERNARLRYVIPQDATYILHATAAQPANGTFRIGLTLTNPTATPPLPEVAARPLYARLVTGREQALLDSRTPFRVYAAVLQRGDTLRAALTVSPTLQAGLYLYRSDFVELTRAELGSRLDLAAPADGVYWLLVARVGGQGDYTLDAELPARALDTFDGVRLIPGQAQPGILGIGAFYTFTTLGGLAADVSVSGAIVILLDPRLALIAADAGGNIRGAEVHEAGSYGVLVLASGGPNQLQPLEYTLILRGTPIAQPAGQSATIAPTADPTELTYGVTASGTISSAKPRIFYNLRGREGDVITVQMSRVSGSTLDPALLLYQYIDGKPQLIASNDNAAPDNPDAAIIGLRLPATGAYLIVAQGVGTTGGAFILSVNRRG